MKVKSMDINKTKRTTKEQLNYFIEFANNHPQLLANKNDPSSPQRVKELWSEVADGLNSIYGPVRSASKWKETLTHWKHSVRSRARKIKNERKATGGGPQSQKKLNEFEERAMQCFGAIAVDGLPNLPTLGISKDNGSSTISKHEDESEDNDYVEEFFLNTSDSNQQQKTPQVSGISHSIFPSPLAQKSNPKSKKTSIQELLQLMLMENQERKEKDDEMFKKMATIQNSLAAAINALAESIKLLADSISERNAINQENETESCCSDNS